MGPSSDCFVLRQGADRARTLIHLTDGGWRGELPLPGSYDKPGVAVGRFVVTREADDGGDDLR